MIWELVDGSRFWRLMLGGSKFRMRDVVVPSIPSPPHHQPPEPRAGVGLPTFVAATYAWSYPQLR